MSTISEPPSKKIKVSETENKLVIETIDEYIEKMRNSQKNLEAVLSDDIFKPIPLTKVYVGHIKDPKQISRTVITLNVKIPLKDLLHLKRVRKREVILCPTPFLNGVSSIQEFIEFNVNELKDVFEYFKELDVPLCPPKLKKQFKECNKLWPCHFHPNAVLEKVVNGNFFTPDEIKLHQIFMEMVFEIVKFNLKDKNILEKEDVFKNVNAAVVYDPAIHSVVAVSFDNREDNPIQHAAMLAIDNVAKTQNGGAWVNDKEILANNDSRLRGIECNLMIYLKKQFPNANFGANQYRSKRDLSQEEASENVDCGPYLCTGYYIYLLREPCVMCSMGLVHARAKRVFFCFENNTLGALKSRTKLQTVQSLNHHFEVFTGFI